MEVRIFSKELAQKVVDTYKSTERVLVFKHPDVLGDLTVHEVAVAPFREEDFNIFMNNYIPNFGANKALETYAGDEYKVVALCESRAVALVQTKRHFHPFDIHELSRLEISGFPNLESILEKLT